jgi:hypothetical protein
MQASDLGSDHSNAVAPAITGSADYWRRRSEEALEVAYELRDGPAITRMLEIGRQYERLARQAEERERKTR